MERIQALYDLFQVAAELQLNRLGVKTRDDHGAVATEMAVVIAAMVAIAVAAAVIFIAKARSNANNIPDTVNPPN